MNTYLTVVQVKRMQVELIERYGGSHGIRDENGLEAAVMRPQNGYYENIIQEAAALMESLAMNHPFVDGNKRIAFNAADTFLRLNGYFIQSDTTDTYQFFIGLFESSSFDFVNLEKWLAKHVKTL